MPWWESNPELAEIAKFSVIEEITITTKELGRGAYGTVYAAVHNGKPCAAKEMHPYLKHDKLETFVREINTLSTLKHPSIVQFLGVYFKTKSRPPILVMEMMWKNLCALLEEQPNKLFLLTKVHILYDVASGLQYLHGQKKPVVHRDLHPSNILLNENLNAKIADLGQAKPLHEAAQKLSIAPGYIPYMAPETLKKKPKYDTKLDVFSIGCTIIHLVTEQFPAPTDQYVETKDFTESFHRVSEVDRRIEFLNLMKGVPVLQKLTLHCLEDAPTNRPVASYICEELEKYIIKLESEAPVLAKQHKQDKFSLLQLLQSQESQLEGKRKIIEGVNKDKSMLNDALGMKEEYILSLEAQCQECKKKLEEYEVTMFTLNRDKESLQKELTDLNKINKDLATTYKNQMDLLREDVKAKQEDIKAASEIKIQMQNEIEDLQDKLKNERSIVSQKIQLVSDLETNIQKMKADADKCKVGSSKANSDYSTKVKTLEQHINQLESRLEENNKQIEVLTAEKDSIIADLNDKLKILEHQSTQSIATHKDQLEEKIAIIEDINKDNSMLNDALVNKEKCISLLESQCQEYKSKLEENEATIVGLNQDKESIQDQMNKSLTNAYKNKDQLNENIKTKEEEIKHLTIENKELQLKVNESQMEAVYFKEQINTKQHNSTNNEGVMTTAGNDLSKMLKFVRSQRDRLHLELEESKKYTAVLKQNFDTEVEKREAIEDEVSKAKEGIKRLHENIKEVEKIWNDTKISMEKLLLIVEGKDKTAIVLKDIQKEAADCSGNDYIYYTIEKLKLELEEWGLQIKEVGLQLSDQASLLDSKSIQSQETIDELEKDLKEKNCQLSNYKIRLNEMEAQLSEDSSKLKVHQLKSDNDKLVKKSVQLRKSIEEKNSQLSDYQFRLNQKEGQLLEYQKELLDHQKELLEYQKEIIKLEFGDSFVIDDSNVNISSEILGSGSYAVIYAAQYHGKLCAAKVAHSKSDKKFHKSIRRECKFLVTLTHPCIISLVGILFTQDDPLSLVILMERMWMSLTEFLKSKRSFQDKITILHDIACGLCYIHNKNIIHCDLTGNNILLTSSVNARIADFGQAVTYDPTNIDNLCTNPGNVYHMPPEASSSKPNYSTKLDIFSFGCVMIHTVTQEFPIPNRDRYVETSNAENYEKLSEVDRREVLIRKLKHHSNRTQLHRIAIECLQDHPDNRPAAGVLHLQLEKCIEESSKICTRDPPIKSKETIQKRVKHFRSLYRKSYKGKYRVYKRKRKGLKHMQELHKVSGTESVSSSTESFNSLLTKAITVENVCPEISLSSKRQEANMAELISKQLVLLIKLDISGCDVSGQGVDMITAILLKTASLKEFSIANAKLNTATAIRILTALKNIFSLEILRMNNNDIEDEATNSLITVINHNHLIKELNTSCNKLSPSGIIPVIQTLSKITHIKVLDISGNFKNYSSPNKIEDLTTALTSCPTLQELNMSDNNLTFTDLLKITRALRGHPSLKTFNINNNIASFFLECEFLVNIILSTNHQLTDVSVCGRNIRPRFNDECLFFPLNCDENSNRFILQNLYLTRFALVNRYFSNINTNEKCSGNMVFYDVDYNGGTFYNQDHDFAIVIPPGAVSQEESVQIQATASHFGPYKIPNGCYPVSSYFWLSSCYTFKIPVYLIMGHYAEISDLEDIENLCLLQTCAHDLTGEEELVMKEVSSGVYFDRDISYCVFATDHFCSFCVGKKCMHIPGKFSALLYTYDTVEGYFAEVCFCPAPCDCKEVIKKQFAPKKGIHKFTCPFTLAEEEMLYVSSDFSVIKGWSVLQFGKYNITFNDIEYWKSCDNIETAKKFEESCEYPPRLQIQCIRHSDNMSVDLHFCFNVNKKSKNDENMGCIGTFPLVKNVIAIHKSDSSSVAPSIPRTGSHYVLEGYCSQPEHRVLSSIRREFGHEWKHVGYSLGLEHTLLKTIESNVHNIEEQAFNMLSDWIQRDTESCYCKLIIAMKKENLSSGIEHLKYWIRSAINPVLKQSDVQTGMQKSAVSLRDAIDHEADASSTLPKPDPLHKIVLTDKLQMHDLNKIVIPKIKEEWEDFAYALHYDIPTVDKISEKRKEDSRKCCQDIFVKWLREDSDDSPKTWSTLLEILNDIDSLSTATKEIMAELSA